MGEFLSIAGFSIVVPFLPYYVQELGVTDPRQVKLWSGLLYAGHAVTMAVLAPIWGSLSDRYGRKLMVERAMFAGALVLSTMGFAQSVHHLFLLRVLQGGLTGTITAANTLVASTAPRNKAGYALGLLQMAIYAGASAGPFLGGFIADNFGFRAAFWVTGGLLFFAGWLVFVLVAEDFHPPDGVTARQRSLGQGLKLVIRSRPLLAALNIRLVIRVAVQLINPMLPLFVQSLVPGQARVASLAGLVSGVNAAANAMAAVVLGRVADKVGYRRVLVSCGLAAVACYIPQSFVRTPGELAFWQALSGLTTGGILATLSAILAIQSPEGRQGVVYGVEATMVSIANAIGPMTGAFIAASLGLRPTFLFVAGMFSLATIASILLLPHQASSLPELGI